MQSTGSDGTQETVQSSAEAQARLLDDSVPGLSRLHPLDFCTSLSSTVNQLDWAGLTAEQLGLSLDLRPFMNPVPLAMQEVSPVSRVFRVFRGLGLRHLVLERNRRLEEPTSTRPSSRTKVHLVVGAQRGEQSLPIVFMYLRRPETL